MPRKKGMVPLHILVTEHDREMIKQQAEARGFKITADYIRHLIESDMKSNGLDVDLGVDRGGYRRSENK